MRFSQAISSSHKASPGFSLIEILIAVTIFLLIGGGIYFTYANLIEIMARTRTHTLATSLLNKQIELIRNLPYDSVGIVGGYPAGVISATSSIQYEGQTFLLSAFVRNIDDAFDGKQGATPNDTAPADYRLVELQVTCTSCQKFVPVIYTTWASPQNLESSTQNGSLFVTVFDANGKGIEEADVVVKNTSTTPKITIVDATNNSGSLQLVDIPTSTNAYQISVGKTGYTSRTTYLAGNPVNPNPLQPHATVASQQITAISFAIDRVSAINLQTQNQYCAAVPAVALQLRGQKLIGTSPNVLLYSQSFVTDAAGAASRGGLEWDTYSLSDADSAYDIAGSVPLSPLVVNPNVSINQTVLVDAAASSSLLTTIVTASGTPLADVLVALVKTGFSQTRKTGERQHIETDWSGARYASQDGNLTDNNPVGQLRLKTIGGLYPTSTNSFVESNTIDFGTSTTSFRALAWSPSSQPAATTLKLQLAASTASGGPFVFSGPDGTSGSYFTTTTSTLATTYDGKRYIRYRAYFNTTDPAATPTLQDLTLVFASGCAPGGQILWSAIPTGTYTATFTKAGYQTATSSIVVGSGWQEARVTLQ